MSITYDELVDSDEFGGLSSERQNEVLNHYGYDSLPEAEEVEAEERAGYEYVTDPLIALGQGFISAGESAVGLVDLVTPGDLQGILHDATGYDPKVSTDFLEGFLSESQKNTNRKVTNAEGFGDTVLEYIKNPSAIAQELVKTAPLMVGSAGMAKSLVSTGLKVLPRAAIGEGLTAMGSSQAGLTEELGRETTLREKAHSLATGMSTAAINRLGGSLAKKLGIADIDSYLAGQSGNAIKGKVLGRIAAGGFTEGVIEEMPQSAIEQVLQNSALEKPLMEGVSKAAATGLAVGAAMGGGFNVLSSNNATPTPEQAEAVATELENTTDADGFKSVKNVVEANEIRNAAGITNDLTKLDETIEDVALEEKFEGVTSDVTGLASVSATPDDMTGGVVAETLASIQKNANIKQEGKQLGEDLELTPVTITGATTDAKTVQPISNKSAGVGTKTAIPKPTNTKPDATLTPETPHLDAMTSAVDQGGIDIASAKQMFSPEAIVALGKKRPGLFRKEGGQGIDDVASQQGYESANQMVEMWSETNTKKEDVAKAEAEAQAEYDIAEDASQADAKETAKLYGQFRADLIKEPASIAVEEIDSAPFTDSQKQDLRRLKNAPKVKRPDDKPVDTATPFDALPEPTTKLSQKRNQTVQNDFRRSVNKVLKNSKKTDAIMAVVEARAGAMGMTAGEYIAHRGIKVVPDSKGGTAKDRAEANAMVIRGEHENIIHAFEGANKNVSTILHELVHIFRKDLPPKLLASAERAFGVKDGNWTTAQEERFARQAEVFFKTGEAKSPRLKKVFENFKQWLTDIYKGYSTLEGVEVSAEAKAVFDEMLGSEGGQKNGAVGRGSDTLMQRKNKQAWPDDFPNVKIHTTIKKMKDHPDYTDAKAGDVDAAVRLVGDIIKPSVVEEIASNYPDAIVVAPHAEELTGRNAIPVAYSISLEDAGLKSDTNIVQSNKAQRTTKDGALRMAIMPKFSGKVEAGKDYILVDDVVGAGGTLNELRFYIENAGGNVVYISTLTAGRGSTIISIRPKTIRAIEEKYGRAEAEDFIKEFNTAGVLEALTERQGKTLLGGKSATLDTLRDRIAASAQEADIPSDAWEVQTPVLKQEKSNAKQKTTIGRIERNPVEPLTGRDLKTKERELRKAGFYSQYNEEQSANTERGRRSVLASDVPTGRRKLPATVAEKNRKKWFDGSLAVQPDGVPQTWFHGSPTFGVADDPKTWSFDQSRRGENVGHTFTGLGMTFTPNYEMAKTSARGGEVTGFNLQARNPYVLTPADIKKLSRYSKDDKHTAKAEAFAKRAMDLNGHDSIYNPATGFMYVPRSTQSKEIRNTGGYSEDTGDVLMQEKQKPVDTNSKNFKRWFDDSKVVDDDGEPLVVYHGTDAEFDAFNEGEGIYFSPRKTHADRFSKTGKVMDVYLSAEKLFDTREPAHQKIYNEMFLRKWGNGTELNEQGLPDWVESHDFKEFFESEGLDFDGAVVGEPPSLEADGRYTPEFSYMVFNPTQIKSATSNTGEFSSTEPSILKQSKQKPKWFSPTAKAVANMKQAKGSGKQMLAMVRKAAGVKPAELEWMGLPEWIEGKKTVTREEIAEFVEQNGVQVEEVVKDSSYDARTVDDDDLESVLNNKYGTVEISGDTVYVNPEVDAQDEDTGWETWSKGEIIGQYSDEFVTQPTRHSQYQLEGGKNYKEILLTLPTQRLSEEEARKVLGAKEGVKLSEADITHASNKKAEQYRSPSAHWDEANVLAFVRFNERTDKDGRKVLFLEEVQSDWAQEGRKKGFGDTKFPRREFAEQQLRSVSNQGVPNTPFKKTPQWSGLAMKRMIRYASENGFDSIAWTTGEQQAERYDLSKQIDHIMYNPSTEILTAGDLSGNEVLKERNVKPEKLDDFIGKEAADKMREKIGYGDEYFGEIDDHDTAMLENQDLKVGSEGMKAFYDKMLPNTVNKLIKKQGGKVGVMDLDSTGKQLGFDITPKMQESAVSEGMPLFQEKQAPTTQAPTVEDYEANYKTTGSRKTQAGRMVRSALADISKGSDKFLGSISTRLGDIKPKLKAAIRKLDYDIGTHQANDTKSVVEMLKITKKMARRDHKDWDYARKNSDTETIDRLIEKYDFRKEYQEYRDTMDRIYDEAQAVGIDLGYIKDYAPRILKDSKGFLNAIGKGDDWGRISEALKARAAEMEISVSEMTAEQRADLVSNVMFGSVNGVGLPGNVKERKIKTIPADLNQYYMDSDAALVSYLHGMRKTIEQRKFFGKVPDKVSKAKASMHRAMSQLRKELKKDEPDQERVQTLRNNVALNRQIIDKFNNNRNDYSESINQYVSDLVIDGDIEPDQENTLIDIMQARFHERGAYGLVGAYKNFSYLDTMGSPLSALTQIGDQAWSMYKNGIIPTLKNSYLAAKGKSRISKEDIGVDRMAQEFADETTLASAVNTVFKMVGLEKIDSIGKETMLNSSLERYQKEANSNPEALASEIEYIFEGETDQVISDLQNDVISDNVKYLLFSDLLDFQPAALSEMSEKYLSAGNGRLFYMLKTYTLKQFDVIRRESYKKIRHGDKSEKIQGVKNLVRLSMLLVLANGTADELKDFVLRRETDWSDRLVDNLLRLMGISKFTTWQARQEGVGTAMAKQLLFPYKAVDAVTRDIVTAGDDKGLKSVGSIPVGGKLYDWWFGRSSHKRSDLQSRRLKKVRKKYSDIEDRVERHPDEKTKYRKELRTLKRINKVQSEVNTIKRDMNRAISNGLDAKAKRLEKRRNRIIKEFLKTV